MATRLGDTATSLLRTPSLQTERERVLVFRRSGVGRGTIQGHSMVASRWWLPFCHQKGLEPYLGPRLGLVFQELIVVNTDILSCFVVWVYPQLNGGVGGLPQTCDTYVQRLCGWHRVEYGTRVTYDKWELARVIDGLRENRLMFHGVETRTRAPAFSAQDIQAWHNIPRTIFDWDSARGISLHALICTGVEGINRADELTWMHGADLERQPTRAAVRWFLSDDTEILDLPQGLDRLSHMLPGKTDKFGTHAAENPSVLFWDPSRILNAAAALERIERRRPCATRDVRRKRPLFQVRQSGYTYTMLSKDLRLIEDASRATLQVPPITPKSIRVSGATLAKLAGMSPEAIRAKGRWGSDIEHLYYRNDRGEARRFYDLIYTVAHQPLPH